MQASFKVRVHLGSTQPSEHSGKLQTERAFRRYANIEACGTTSKRGRFPKVQVLRGMRDSLKVRAQSDGKRPSERAGQPEGENASLGYTTLGEPGISPPRPCIPRIRNPRSTREILCLQKRVPNIRFSENQYKWWIRNVA